MTTNLSAWPLTMQVVVRDRSAELPDGSPVTRALTISAFCWRCCVRRGPATTLTDYHLNYTYQVSHWEHPCGHVDSNEDIITEAELSCAAVECVLIVSDADYPYCSAECSKPRVRTR
jgi:hypothetical protein